MDLQAAKAAFDRDGFVHIKGFLNADEVAALNTNLQRYIDEVLPTLPAEAGFYEIKDRPDSLMRLQNMYDYDGYFRELYFDRRCIELGEALLGDQLRPKNMQWFNKPARIGNQTPPHQDGFYFMLEPNEALTLWLAQDAADEENGCVRYLPGSHRGDMRPHQRTEVLGFSQGITDYGASDRAAELPVCAAPGDLIAHHSLTVHRADPNPSPRPRRALGLVYFAERAREDAARAEAYRQRLYREWEAEGKI